MDNEKENNLVKKETSPVEYGDNLKAGIDTLVKALETSEASKLALISAVNILLEAMPDDIYKELKESGKLSDKVVSLKDEDK